MGASSSESGNMSAYSLMRTWHVFTKVTMPRPATARLNRWKSLFQRSHSSRSAVTSLSSGLLTGLK